MRIIIDLQACQNADPEQTQDLLALVHAMARQAASRDLWIAFSNQFPSRIDLLRATLANVVPAERMVVCDTPAPDGTGRMQQTIDLIRNNFFGSMGAALVFAPGLFDHAAGTVGAITPQPRPFSVVVSISSADVLAEPHGATPARAESFARQQASLQCADLLLAGSPEVASLLGAAIDGARIATFAGMPDAAAQQIWSLLDEVLAAQQRATLPEGRPRLAYMSPLPPERSGIADYSAELITQLEH